MIHKAVTFRKFFSFETSQVHDSFHQSHQYPHKLLEVCTTAFSIFGKPEMNNRAMA
jgi:hypothetical protein